MKLMNILVLALSMFALTGNVMAEDLHVYIELTGPWSFIPVINNANYCGALGSKCIIAISLSKNHQHAMFNGVSLNEGVYTLMLQDGQPDSINGGTPAKFVDGLSVSGARLQELLAQSGQNTYVITLPYAPYAPDTPLQSSFEQPAGDHYSENAKITDDFVPFYQTNAATEIPYTKGVRIHYIVSSLSATLSGKDDAGNTVSIQKTAPITFSVDPANGTIYICDLHARLTFRRMNDLFHPQPNPKPRKYVDFPDYGWQCRVGDPQQDGLPELISDEDSKNINTSALMQLIKSLKKSANALKAKHITAKGNTFNDLLKDVRKYLHNRSKNREKGMALIDRLGTTIQSIGDPTNPNTTEQERILLRDLGILLLLVKIETNDSGANCKAPMMSVALQ